MRALVVGGTGPTGPLVLTGLLERGYEVVILHSGRHEVDTGSHVEHVHVDPNLTEEFAAALSGRHFDVAICLYGRTRFVVKALRGHADRVVTVSGVFYKGWVDSRLLREESAGPTRAQYLPHGGLLVDESSPMGVEGSFSRKAVETEEQILAWHANGELVATLLRFPLLYGPRQLAPAEWSIVRRVLDGRRRLLVPDGGLLLTTRLSSINAAGHLLAAVDHPEAAGEIINCGDTESLTLRDWATILAAALDWEFEFVSVPFDFANITFPYSLFPFNETHRLLDLTKARELLRYSPLSPLIPLSETARWYADYPLERGGPDESQLGDAFKYEYEDELAQYFFDEVPAVLSDGGANYRHPYSHPKSPEKGGASK